MLKVNLMHGDCLDKMKEIPSGSIDLILTDPPYGTVKGAGLDGWKNQTTEWDTTIPHKEMLEECNRVLRTNGCLILFCQDPYTGKLMTEQHGNLPFSYRLIWLKDHFANALIAKKAPVNYTEDICVFFKKYDTLAQHPLREYVLNIKKFIGKTKKEIFNEMGHQGICHFFRDNSTQFSLCTEKTYNELIDLYQFQNEDWFMTYYDMEEINKTFNKTFNLPKNKAMKSNVLKYKKDYGRLHPTQKPVNLMIDLIKTYTNKKDTVLDFTMGSGSTGVACKETDRNFIGIEKDDKYFETAKDRINNHVVTLKLDDFEN